MDAPLAPVVDPSHPPVGRPPESASPLTAGRSTRGLLPVLLACLLAQVTVGLSLARLEGFWSPDSAVRFIQVQSVLRSHYRDVAVPYPARSLDGNGSYFPMGRWFHSGQAGRFYLSYLPYFSMASAPFYRLLAFPGLFLIPMASVLGTVWITYRVLQRRVPGLAVAAAGALGLATPLFIYGVVFWDHSLAVLVSTGALALLCGEVDGRERVTSGRLVAAGALLGAGCWIRSEIYLLGAAAALGWIVASPRGRIHGLIALVGGMAVPVAGLWTLNTRLFGSPFGWKGDNLVATRVGGVVRAASGGTSAAGTWLAEKLGNAYYQLVSPDFYAFNPRAVVVGLAIALALVLAGVLLRAGVCRRSVRTIEWGMIVGVAASLVVLSNRTTVSGLLPAAPFVVLALLPGPAARWERALWITSILFCGAVVITGTHGGLQWGPRYLLPIVPALVWLAAAAVARARAAAPVVWPSLRLGAAALLAASLIIQASGVDQVQQATARNARINGWLRGLSAEIIITPLEWLTLGAGPVYFEKALMLVQTPDALKALVEHLSSQHVARWAYIPYWGPAFNPGAVTTWTEGRPWRFRPVEDSSYEGLRIVTYAGSSGTSGSFTRR